MGENACSDRDRLALDVWIDFLSRCSSSDTAALEATCAKHPELASRLRDLQAKGARRVGGQNDRNGSLGGSRHARYRRECVIGSGGMGIVHRAHDLELDRVIAIKEIRSANRDNDVASTRFLEEAHITARLDHPGIVPVHELGRDEEGRMFFAMKLVEGRNLETILGIVHEGREGWPQTRVVAALLKVCEAMAYAHSKGVIHRDLKPANVMVGRFGEVYVMDWGLARVIGRRDAHDIRLRLGQTVTSVHTKRQEPREETPDSPLVTMDGAVVGTPAYMSPEQARGEIHLLSPRSDVYSIGAMLYHLLTGRAPYVPSGARMSKHSLLAHVIEGPPRPIQEIVRGVPVELMAICEKAMAREPMLRYPDTSALGDDLRAYLEGRVVRAHETGAIPELRKWIGRNKGLAAACGTVLLTLAGGLATSSSLYVHAAEKNTEVQRLSALQELDDLVVEADALWPIGSESVASLERWLGRAHELLAGLPGHQRKLASLQATNSPADRWWICQLDKLVDGLNSLSDPAQGLLAGISSEHGWGIERRLRFSRELTESPSRAESDRLWSEATQSIRDPSECPHYGGLELTPQSGLIPIGRDPESGLWEFAHLLSGLPARRDSHGTLQLSPDTGLVLILVPGGSFWMGTQGTDIHARRFVAFETSAASAVHEVHLAPFFLAKFEMTQGQWAAFTGTNPSTFQHNPLAPVETISWYECDVVLRRLGLVLPTEAQWEYACRAGTDTTWWTGDEVQDLHGAANLADLALLYDTGMPDLTDCWYEKWLDDGAPIHTVVGTYAPNAFGLHDVHGNVAEWCRDLAIPYGCPHVAGDGELIPCDVRGLSWENGSSRSMRGGDWSHKAQMATCSGRGSVAPEGRGAEYGLRPARTIHR